MAKKTGEEFIAGIKRNMAATGYVPPAKKVNIPLQTLKYLPGEIVKTVRRIPKKVKKFFTGK
jgi:hypothetical protein